MTSIDSSKTSKSGQGVYLSAAYYLVIALFLLASLFPEARVWGINWWGYLPFMAKLGLLMVGIAVLPTVTYWARRSQNDSPPIRDAAQRSTGYLRRAGLTIILFGFSFVMFRGTTHFLGDGYQLLSRLADRVPPVKTWDVGATLIHFTLFSLLSGEPNARALLTYQTISIASGVGLLVTIAFLSRTLFNDNLQRYLFFLGLASGGYMLMFFGYVENYALLVSAIMVYVLMGLVALKGKASQWWVAPPLLLAIFLHIFSVLLIPSLLYLMLRNTPIGQWIKGLSAKMKLLIGAAVALVGVFIYYYLYTNYYFFTFALLPIVPNRFTVENDTLFSIKHVTDICNLLMLLVPGLPVFLTAAMAFRGKGLLRRAEYRFLLIIVLSTLGAIWVFNPGIGMPRNWDLFSIVGVPLAVICFYYVLENCPSVKDVLCTAVPAIALGFLLLVPRIATQAVPNLAIAHFKNYLVLDKIRNRNGRELLIDYYERIGDTTAAKEERARKERDFPEISLHRKGVELMSQGRLGEALNYFQRALLLNPLYYNVYANVGGCYLHLGNLDSALVLLKIADGVNPYSPSIITNIGTAYLRKGEYDRAQEYFLRSLQIDSTGQNALAGLASVYLQLNQFDRSLNYVSKIHALTDMPYDYFRQAGDAYLDKKAFAHAAQAYKYALDRGLDSSYVKNLSRKFPQLKW
jgi:tetratricopeptide (TPR) repeat protein